MTSFQKKYNSLEMKMYNQAISDGDIYLPNLKPSGQVDYVLICMEPSLGSWAKSEIDAKKMVKDGFNNFIFSFEDYILHFCVNNYLCNKVQKYHLTDISKGAMLVKFAENKRFERYKRWHQLLKEELNLVSNEKTKIIAVGKAVESHLIKNGYKDFFTVIHYSNQAASTRNLKIQGREHFFNKFKNTVSSIDILITANEILENCEIAAQIKNDIIDKLSRSKLTESRKKLIFIYKNEFEIIKQSNLPK